MKPPLIILTGFMGAGKTVYGRALAEALDWVFTDLDEVIAREAGEPVADIIQNQGEARFRELESQVLRSLEWNEPTVLAAGGGAPLREVNREWMRENGLVVYLKPGIDILCQRLEKETDQRPLLEDARKKHLRALVREMLKQREPDYLKGDWVIDPVHLPPAELARHVSAYYSR